MSNFIAAIEQFAKNIASLISTIFRHATNYFEAIINWIDSFRSRVFNYIRRLTKTTVRFLGALLKLLLIYTPAIVLFTLGGTWVFISIGYVIVVTLIGLFYRKS